MKLGTKTSLFRIRNLPCNRELYFITDIICDTGIYSQKIDMIKYQKIICYIILIIFRNIINNKFATLVNN